jgi:hypothetical protein
MKSVWLQVHFLNTLLQVVDYLQYMRFQSSFYSVEAVQVLELSGDST